MNKFLYAFIVSIVCTFLIHLNNVEIKRLSELLEHANNISTNYYLELMDCKSNQ
jgi:hypothetical protein